MQVLFHCIIYLISCLGGDRYLLSGHHYLLSSSHRIWNNDHIHHLLNFYKIDLIFNASIVGSRG